MLVMGPQRHDAITNRITRYVIWVYPLCPFLNRHVLHCRYSPYPLPTRSTMTITAPGRVNDVDPT